MFCPKLGNAKRECSSHSLTLRGYFRAHTHLHTHTHPTLPFPYPPQIPYLVRARTHTCLICWQIRARTRVRATCDFYEKSHSMPYPPPEGEGRLQVIEAEEAALPHAAHAIIALAKAKALSFRRKGNAQHFPDGHRPKPCFGRRFRIFVKF